MLRSVGLKAFYDQWRGTFSLAFAMAVYSGALVALYPSISSIIAIRDIFDKLPPAMRALFAPGGVDMTTPEGFIATEFFSIVGPLLFFGYTIAVGGSATAAEEERGTIDMLAALPVARWRIPFEKFLALIVGTAILGVALWGGIAVGSRLVGVELRLEGIAALVASAALMGLLFGALALWIGATTGRRTFSIGLAFGAAIASYFIYSFSELVDLLKPVRPLSPFTYYIGDNPLLNGLLLQNVVVLVGATLIFVVLALVSFQRRDLRV
jgi:ABC-2 type transport system permease protein